MHFSLKLNCILSLVMLAGCSSFSKSDNAIKIKTTQTHLPQLSAMVNGESQDFILDSGAVVVVLNKLPRATSIQDLKPAPDFLEFAGPVNVQGALDVTLKIKNHQEQKVSAVLSSSHQQSILPLQTLLSPRITFDFPNGRIIPEGPAFCDPQSDFRYQGNLMILSGHIDKQVVHLIWDTGSQVSVLDKNWTVKHNLQTKTGPEIAVLPSSGKVILKTNSFFVVQKFFERDTNPLGFFVLPLHENFGGPAANIQGLLGFHFIKDYRWHFDLSSKKYCFAP